MNKKIVCILIIGLFIGTSIVPVITGNDNYEKNVDKASTETIWVNNIDLPTTSTLSGNDKETLGIDDDLVGYWSFDDSGDVGHDDSGNGNNGVNYGATYISDGAVNGAVKFDGVDDYISISDSESLRFDDTNEFSISGWLKVMGSAGNPKKYIVSKGLDGYHQEGYGLLYNNHAAFEVGDSSNVYPVHGVSNVENGDWHHVVGLWDHGNSKIFIDGNLESQDNFSITIAYTGTTFFIGNNYWLDHCVDGVIDEVRIYERALSDNEIVQLYYQNSAHADAGGPYYAELGERITLDASGSLPEDGGVISLCCWELDGDGQYDDRFSLYPKKTVNIEVDDFWDSYNEYTIGLKIITQGNTYNDTAQVIIEPTSYFVHITDTHVGTTGGLTRFLECINHINSFDPQPEFVVISGDLVHFGLNPVHWVLFAGALDILNATYHLCCGNHDHMGIDQLTGFPFDPFSDFSIKPVDNVHLIGMDSGGDADFLELAWFPFDMLPEGSGLTSLQYIWLYSTIFNEYNNCLKVVFMHHPIVYDDDKYFCYGDEKLGKNGCILNYRSDFLSGFRDEIDLVLGGHTHCGVEYQVPNGFEDDPKRIDIGDGGYKYANGIMYYESPRSNSTNDFEKPMYVVTGACGAKCNYRNITIKEDEFIVHGQDQFAQVGGYETNYIPFTVYPYKNGQRNNNSTYFPPSGRLHVYTSNGSHIGINETGEIDDEIPFAYYEDISIYNETDNSTISFGEIISVEMGQEEYTYEFETLENSSLFIYGDFPNEFGSSISIYYQNITAYNGSIGRTYIHNYSNSRNKDINDHLELQWDDDGDNVTDRIIQPTEIFYPPNKPETPTGPATGLTYTECQFETNSSDLNNDTLSYFFDWGDGTISGPYGPFNSTIVVTANHSWIKSGTYNIKVQAVDNTSKISEWSNNISITIENRVPVADFTHTPFILSIDSDINFTDVSYDLDGAIFNWSWSFGDGNISVLQNPTHNYSNSGIYHVILTVTDDDGATDTTAKLVLVDVDISKHTSLSDGWNLVSLPFNQSINKDDIILRYNSYYYGLYDGIISNFIFGWDRLGQYYNIAYGLDPGYGYWLYSYEDCELWLENFTLPPEEPYITHIKTGWNIISIPYTENITKSQLLVNDLSWSDAVSSGILSDFIFGWNRNFQYYNFADTLMPGYGYWIYSHQPCTLKRTI